MVLLKQVYMGWLISAQEPLQPLCEMAVQQLLCTEWKQACFKYREVGLFFWWLLKRCNTKTCQEHLWFLLWLLSSQVTTSWITLQLVARLLWFLERLHLQQSPPLPRTEQESDKEIQERKEEKGTHKGCPQAVVQSHSSTFIMPIPSGCCGWQFMVLAVQQTQMWHSHSQIRGNRDLEPSYLIVLALCYVAGHEPHCQEGEGWY